MRRPSLRNDPGKGAKIARHSERPLLPEWAGDRVEPDARRGAMRQITSLT